MSKAARIKATGPIAFTILLIQNKIAPQTISGPETAPIANAMILLDSLYSEIETAFDFDSPPSQSEFPFEILGILTSGCAISERA